MRGIGVDIEEIARFEQVDQNFLDLIYSPEEQGYCLKKASPAQHLAGHFCVKEAVIKAVSTSLLPRQISVLHNENGSPYVEVEGVQGDFEVSISHSGAYAVAFVVYLG